MEWIQKDQQYSLTKLDNRLSKNAQDICQSPKVYHTSHEKLESGNERRKENFSWGEIQSGTFQGDALSLLLFVIAMMPLKHIRRKCTEGYKFTESKEKINHQMYKLFAEKMKKNWTFKYK